MKQFGKIRAAAGFLLVFLLVLGTNRIDKHHFETVQKKVTSVYEDRVMAQHYLYQANAVVRDKVHLIRYEGLTNSVELARLDSLLDEYGKTQLTKEETRLFERLQRQLKNLVAISSALTTEAKSERVSDQALLETEKQIRVTLDRLSAIQQEEGRNLQRGAQASLDRNSFLSRVELLALAIIAVLIQLIIFYQPPKD